MGVSSAGWGMQEDASKDDSTFNRHIVMEDLKREVSNHLDKVERTFHALILSFFDVLADLKQSSTGGAIDPRYGSLPYRHTSSEAGGGMNNKENRISTNFSFLRFRLDFNEYYAAERRLNTLGMPSRV